MQALEERDDVAVLLARQQEEAATWSRVSQELYLEYDRLFAESTQERRDFQAKVARLEEDLLGANQTLAEVCSKLAYREAQHAKVRRSFLFTFFSLSFTIKQVIKLILMKLKVRQAPDPTDYLAGDD
jgi:hypothetical protein